MQLPDAQYVLQAAARRTYADSSQVKLRLLQQLLRSMSDLNDPSTADTLSLDAAASICHLPASALLPVLASDSSFRVKKSSSGSYSISLNADALLQKGRQTTKTGILVEELAPPDGYIDGRHPIRPDRQMCWHWGKHGTCAYYKTCVFNHTEEARGKVASQLRPRQQPPSPHNSSLTALGPTTPQPALQQRRPSSSNSSSPTDGWAAAAAGSSSNAGTRGTPASSTAGQHRTPGLPPVSYANAAALKSPSDKQQQQQQEERGGAPAAVAAAAAVSAGGGVQGAKAGGGPSRPGAAPCRLFQIRGFCPQGERCPYDHPVTPGGPATPGAVVAAVSQPSSRSASPLPFEQPLPYQQQQQSTNPQPHQQQQQQEQQESQEGPAYLGCNEHGYPRLKSAANCAFFLGTGRCAFARRCKYHHPLSCMHPVCVLEGTMPRKFDVTQAAPYARLVSHLQRLWDYESSEEAQLKVWLAHHLLARENTGCSMFSPDAACPAVEEDSPDVPRSEDKPRGAYSCTLTEADQVLQLLWKAQPDAVGSRPMPYQGQLRELLGDDPYFLLFSGAGGACEGVKLRVRRMKEQLNF